MGNDIPQIKPKHIKNTNEDGYKEKDMRSPRKKYFKLEEIKKFEDDLKDYYLERKQYVIQNIENLKKKNLKILMKNILKY